MNPLTTEQLDKLENHLRINMELERKTNLGIRMDISNDNLKSLIQSAKELAETKAELAAIQTGIRNEFKSGEASDDILQDFGTFIDHHNLVERQLSVAIEMLERIISGCVHPEKAIRRVMVELAPIRDALKTIAEMG
jgi:hypothetical protein